MSLPYSVEALMLRECKVALEDMKLVSPGPDMMMDDEIEGPPDNSLYSPLVLFRTTVLMMTSRRNGEKWLAFPF